MAGSNPSRFAALTFVAASLLISSCGGASSSGTESVAKRPTPPKVGSSIRMQARGTNLVVTVRRVTFPLRGSGVLLGPGDRAAGVDVAVRNVGHGVYDSSSESDVGLRDSSGEFADPSFAAEGACATSEIDFLKLVQPGESRSGCVAFDVPRGTRPASVRFSPEGRGALGHIWLVKR